MAYNKQFVDFLAKLEGVANPGNKAKIRHIRNAYMECAASSDRALVEQNELLNGHLAHSPDAPSLPSASRYGRSTPEQKEAAAAKSKAQRDANTKAMAGFEDAKSTIMTNAVIQPGKVDGWVDAMLKPAIQKIISQGDGFLDADVKKDQYKRDKAEFMKEFKGNQKAANKELKDAIKKANKFAEDEKAYAREEEEYKAQQKAREERENKQAAKSQEWEDKMTDTGFNPVRDPLNATKEMSAFNAGKEAAKRDFARNSDTEKESTKEATKEASKEATQAPSEEKTFTRAPMPNGPSEDTKERIAAAEKKPGFLSRMKQGVYNWADKNKQALDDEEAAIAKRNSGVANPDIYGENSLASKAGRAVKGGFFGGLKRLFQSVDAEGLRACFESVYGDSSKFSDDDIRTICESVYRRALTEGAVSNNALVESALLEGEALDKILATIKKLGLGSAVVAALAGTAVGGIHALDGQPNSDKQTIEFTSQTPNNMYGKYAAAATDDIKLSAENAKKLLTKVMRQHDAQKDSAFSKACDYMNDLLNSKSALNGTNADSLNHLAKVAIDGTNFAKAQLAKDAK